MENLLRRTVVMFGAVPIPAGHQVEVLAKDVGVFGRDLQAQNDERMVHERFSGTIAVSVLASDGQRTHQCVMTTLHVDVD